MPLIWTLICRSSNNPTHVLRCFEATLAESRSATECELALRRSLMLATTRAAYGNGIGMTPNAAYRLRTGCKPFDGDKASHVEACDDEEVMTALLRTNSLNAVELARLDAALARHAHAMQQQAANANVAAQPVDDEAVAGNMAHCDGCFVWRYVNDDSRPAAGERFHCYHVNKRCFIDCCDYCKRLVCNCELG